ncbi:hypothetical protein BD410DRAFT_840475 [Rickenella mellea]|uniref:Expansin-like EG45 domain-containing protein n=1 Tax=Rickenella mellea TaxID=50990 RepID=A0A4Y7Q282_9AGAM|nr:hypothetical protein BD410DRAFT_840475 [Rickenella mellea]
MVVNLSKRATVIVSALVVWVLATLPGALAQTTNATCLSTYAFLYNSRGQSPCLVAAYAGGVCDGGPYDVDALDVGTHYAGPPAAKVNNCQCSSVFYSLLSACGLCQNRTIIPWSSWDTNCKNVFVTVYPEDIPSSTAIPAWAYVNVSTSDIFDLNNARTLQGSAESTASLNKVTQTGAGAENPTGGVNGAKNKSSNTGAIAGGVGGGVVVIALIGLLASFLIRQRNDKLRNVIAPRQQYLAAHMHAPGPEMQSFTGGSHGVDGGVGYAGARGQQQQSTGGTLTSMSSQKLYNPNDASTFPGPFTPPTPLPPYRQSPQLGGGTLAAAGTYRGVPEV